MCVGLCFVTPSSCLKYSDSQVSSTGPKDEGRQRGDARGGVFEGMYSIMNVHVIHGKASPGGNVEIPRDLIDPEVSREITPLMTLTLDILLITTQSVSPHTMHFRG
jgi:hypothetical protein